VDSLLILSITEFLEFDYITGKCLLQLILFVMGNGKLPKKLTSKSAHPARLAGQSSRNFMTFYPKGTGVLIFSLFALKPGNGLPQQV
jgi:hypothetical protein